MNEEFLQRRRRPIGQNKGLCLRLERASIIVRNVHRRRSNGLQFGDRGGRIAGQTDHHLALGAHPVYHQRFMGVIQMGYLYKYKKWVFLC